MTIYIVLCPKPKRWSSVSDLADLWKLQKFQMSKEGNNRFKVSPRGSLKGTKGAKGARGVGGGEGVKVILD